MGFIFGDYLFSWLFLGIKNGTCLLNRFHFLAVSFFKGSSVLPAMLFPALAVPPAQ